MKKFSISVRCSCSCCCFRLSLSVAFVPAHGHGHGYICIFAWMAIYSPVTGHVGAVRYFRKEEVRGHLDALRDLRCCDAVRLYCYCGCCCGCGYPWARTCGLVCRGGYGYGDGDGANCHWGLGDCTRHERSWFILSLHYAPLPGQKQGVCIRICNLYLCLCGGIGGCWTLANPYSDPARRTGTCSATFLHSPGGCDADDGPSAMFLYFCYFSCLFLASRMLLTHTLAHGHAHTATYTYTYTGGSLSQRSRFLAFVSFGFVSIFAN